MTEFSAESVKELFAAPYRLFLDSFIFEEVTKIGKAKNLLMDMVDKTEKLRLKLKRGEKVVIPGII